MDQLVINGDCKLNGTVRVSKAKNSSLPILLGCLLNENQVTINDLPDLRDIQTTLKLLEKLGASYSRDGEKTIINCGKISSREATYDLVKTMRASILVLGPLLARFGEATVSLPGGCAIGGRPIDIHLKNLEKMGAKISIESGYVKATVAKLKGAHLNLSFPSVGATENLMMAATLADGVTTIENAAKEPEIEDLQNFLNSMGAKVSGAGTSTIVIEGVQNLSAAEHTPIGDRIEACTYIMAALATESSITVTDFNPAHISAVISALEKMGANLMVGETSVEVLESKLSAIEIETGPYPEFPTDAQAQMTALMCLSNGNGVVTETIFENRFMHVPELGRLGAQIEIKGNSAYVSGEAKLSGAPVMCTDLRASAALVIAALAAKGETTISRIYHLDRGYAQLESKLSGLGAKVIRVNS